MGTNTVMVLSAVTVVMIIAPTIAAVVMVVIVAGAVVAVIRMRVVVVHSSRRETTGRPMVRPTLTVRRSRSIVVIVIVVAIIVAIGRMLLLLTMIVLRVDSQLVRLPITQLGSFPVSAFKVIEWLWCQVHGGFFGSRHEVLAMIRLAFLSAPPADCREKTAKQKTNQTMNKPVFRKRQYRSGKQK